MVDNEIELGLVGSFGGYNIFIVPPEVDTIANVDERPLLVLHYDKNMSTSFLGIDSDGNILTKDETSSGSLLEEADQCAICGDNLSGSVEEKWISGVMGDGQKLSEEGIWYPLNSPVIPLCHQCFNNIENISKTILETHQDLITRLYI